MIELGDFSQKLEVQTQEWIETILNFLAPGNS